MGSETSRKNVLVGEVLEESYLVSLADLCRSCTVETHTITSLVTEGILDPTGEEKLSYA